LKICLDVAMKVAFVVFFMTRNHSDKMLWESMLWSNNQVLWKEELQLISRPKN